MTFAVKSLVVLAAAAGIGAPLAASHTVAQKGRAFAVTTLTIKKGESIVFKNEDDVTHNVFSLSPGIKFDIKTQKPGEESKIDFAAAGSGEVRCAIHPTMKMKLTVTE